jgi:pilus assembly protein Flp/PilA
LYSFILFSCGVYSMGTFRGRSEKGAGLVEYALILVLVSIVAIGALSLTGSRIQQIYCDVTEKLKNPGAGGSASGGGYNIRFGGISGCETIGPTGPVGKDIELIVEPVPASGAVQVKFYFDGSTTEYRTESISRYCLSGGGEPDCTSTNLSSLSAGRHTLKAALYNSSGTTLLAQTSIIFYLTK